MEVFKIGNNREVGTVSIVETVYTANFNARTVLDKDSTDFTAPYGRRAVYTGS